MATDKLTTLSAAVRKYVTPGAGLSIGGFTLNRNPMAAVYEIIRQGIDGLHLFAHSNGQGLDELVGAGSVCRADIAYSGNGRYAPTCINFKRMVETNRLLVEDYTNFQMALRFMAGAMGVPFLPAYTALGTDIIARWGYDAQMRQKDPTLPLKKLAVMENPFSRQTPPDKVVLVPAATPDVTIIHVQTADPFGTARIDGLTFCDIDQAKAARHLIITAETIAAPGELNRSPAGNQIPGFCVDAVVHQPWGAYPTACYGIYDYDPQFLASYKQWARTEKRFKAYVREVIKGNQTHEAFIEAVGQNPGQRLKADAETGYSLGVKR